MRCFIILVWTASLTSYDDFGSEWIEQWKNIKSSLESGEFTASRPIEEPQSIYAGNNSYMSDMQYFNHKPEISLSVFDKKASCSQAVGFFAIIFDLLRAAKISREYKDMVHAMSYEQFLLDYPEYIGLEYQILRLQKLIHTSFYGTFPEQIRARIYLVQTSLCEPYGKIVDKYSKKLFKHSFDTQGKFILNKDDYKVSYKKFYKNVPQDWKSILLQVKKLPKDIKFSYTNHYENLVQNEYNKTLIDIVYEGIAQNFPRLKQLCRKYFDTLLQKLYNYYIDKKFMKQKSYYEQHDPFFIENHHNVVQEEYVLRDYYHQELSDWLSEKSYSFVEQTIMYKVVGKGEEVLNLPVDDQCYFTLLRRFVDIACWGKDTDPEVKELFFTEKGVLKKYSNDSYVRKYFQTIELDDDLFHKAVNFALAIQEKEQNLITKKVSQLVLHYVALAYNNEEHFLVHKKKVELLYESLSYNTYDEMIFQI